MSGWPIVVAICAICFSLSGCVIGTHYCYALRDIEKTKVEILKLEIEKSKNIEKQ